MNGNVILIFYSSLYIQRYENNVSIEYNVLAAASRPNIICFFIAGHVPNMSAGYEADPSSSHFGQFDCR